MASSSSRKEGLDVREAHAVLRPAGAGEARLDRGEIELQGVRVDCLRAVGRVEEPLLLHVGLDQSHLLGRAAGEGEVVERDLVHREDAAGGAVLGRHVADGGPVGERQGGEAGAEELDELAHDALLSEHLGDREHEVGGRGPLGQPAGEAEAHHLGDQHGDGLAEHGRLGLDAAHAPAEHAQAVDHGGVGVGAHQGVGVGVDLPLLASKKLPFHDHPGQVFEVDLVDDAGVGRHHLEVAERRLPPAQEGVALAVALEFLFGVDQEGGGGAVFVHLDGVVDHQLDGLERVDLAGVAAHGDHGVAHGGEIDHGGDAGEVLEQDAGRHEGDLPRREGLGVPAGQGLDVVRGDHGAVLPAQQVFEQDAQGIGEALDVPAPLLQGVQAGQANLAAGHLQGRAASKAIFHGIGLLGSSITAATAARGAPERGDPPRG